MRLILSFLGVLTFLAVMGAVPVSAQNVTSRQTPEFGYYVPVIVNDSAVTQAGLSVNLADQPEMAIPLVAPDHGYTYGCDCGACDMRFRGGCGRGCGCLSCRNDRVFNNTFASMEYLHWYNEGINLPPLVTTNIGIPAQAAAGVLGNPTTRVLFGQQGIDDDRQSAYRLTFGTWIDDYATVAFGAKIFDVEGGAVNFHASTLTNPVLGIPFFNADGNVLGEDALLVSYPGVSIGNVHVRAENDVIGSELFVRSLVDSGYSYRLDLIGGYQFTRIDSELIMSTQIATGAGNFSFNDSFDVENEYHGFSAGFYSEVYRDCWTFSGTGKVGIGNMRQTAVIDGNNTVDAGAPVFSAGGLFAQPTNIGTYERDEFVWVPEASIKASCAVTRQLSISVGYSFMYFTRVAFAGDQVDRTVNATQLLGGAVVGDPRPAFSFHDSGFWIQSIDLGLSYNY